MPFSDSPDYPAFASILMWLRLDYPSDCQTDYSLSWSQLHGSGHSHSCVVGSRSVSLDWFSLSMRPKLPTV